ncbi:MAG TPA: response regulator [Bacteroidia bacterium]|nr:response regulator [Bacteroidia bacterium]
MNKTRILVVEDESIVAKDIQKTLEKLGYEVPATASSAASAYEKLEQIEPDLVFLDIKLKGEEDGIHIAGHIKEKYNIPVIFLTSYVDQETLDRAKVTEPYGYIVKPFNESDLKTTVEMALFKFSRDREVRASEQRLANALGKVEEAIIVTDTEGRITYLNEKAGNLLGYGVASAIGLDVFQLLAIEMEGGNGLRKEQLYEAMKKDEAIELEECFVIVKRDNSSVASSFSASSVHDEKNQYLGAALVIGDKQAGAERPVANAELQMSFLDNQVIQNSFFVKKGSMLVKVYLDNIQWIQAMDNYVIIQTTADQFVIHSTMKDIENKLPTSRFLRVHRSYIIPIEKINVLDENTVLIGDKTIPIGKSYKEAFMARLNFL